MKLTQGRTTCGRRRRTGTSEVIAILMLVLIVVGAAAIVLVFASGIINDLQKGGVYSPVTAGGEMVVPGYESNLAMVTLSVRNSDTNPIDSISVSCSAATNCASLSMEYSNQAISASSPLPLEDTAVGTLGLQATSGQFIAGYTYTFLLNLKFAGGSEQTIDVELTATS